MGWKQTADAVLLLPWNRLCLPLNNQFWSCFFHTHVRGAKISFLKHFGTLAFLPYPELFPSRSRCETGLLVLYISSNGRGQMASDEFLPCMNASCGCDTIIVSLSVLAMTHSKLLGVCDVSLCLFPQFQMSLYSWINLSLLSLFYLLQRILHSLNAGSNRSIKSFNAKTYKTKRIIGSLRNYPRLKIMASNIDAIEDAI